MIFSYFDSTASVYRPNHALKCHVTVQKIAATNTVALSGAPYKIERLN